MRFFSALFAASLLVSVGLLASPVAAFCSQPVLVNAPPEPGEPGFCAEIDVQGNQLFVQIAEPGVNPSLYAGLVQWQAPVGGWVTIVAVGTTSPCAEIGTIFPCQELAPPIPLTIVDISPICIKNAELSIYALDAMARGESTPVVEETQFATVGNC